MALTGTITVSTCGMNVSFGTPASTSYSTNENFRAKSFYITNLNTAGNGSFYLDLTTTSGCSTGYTVGPATTFSFPNLGGITGFSSIASTAAGSISVSYLASR